jgi:hypothetical protein
MKRFTGLVAVVAFLVLATLAWGAIPRTINYQGFLKNTDRGTPIDQGIN